MSVLACGGGGGGGEGGGANVGSSVTLRWDAVAGDPTLAGYRIYYGTAPRVYFQRPGQGVDVGDVTSYQLKGLSGGTTYYFAATAYDWSNNESVLSSEVVKVVP